MNTTVIEDIKKLYSMFEEIKKRGYIKTTRTGTTGIGKTFEDLIGKKEDQSYKPDFKEIEIKVKNYYSKFYTTLFNLTPKGNEEHEIKRLKETYGYPDRIINDSKILNSSVYANKDVLISNKYNFKLVIDKKQNKIFLNIKDFNNKMIENYVYWEFKEIKKRLIEKINYIAMIKALKTTVNNETYYKYINIKFYKLRDFETFLKLIETGIIRVYFHIDIFREGKRYKEIHDRGTSFQIKETDFEKLFERIYI